MTTDATKGKSSRKGAKTQRPNKDRTAFGSRLQFNDAGGFDTTLALALTLDVLAGEPPAALHPVVWLGKLIATLERHAPPPLSAPRREVLYGAGMTTLTVGTALLPALLLERVRRSHQHNHIALLLLTAALLKTTCAFRTLLQASGRVAAALEAGDLDTARAALRWLVSRDTSTLDESLIAAATIESLAENASDSVVAPLCFYALFGLPGAFAYRAVNTLDAMVGYRERYEYLGKVPAHLDDLLNLVPARLTALLIVAASAVCGNNTRQAWQAMWHDHTSTASPNAGWPMSAIAGALGIRLEKVGHYGLNTEGRVPTAADIRRAERLVGVAVVLGFVTLLVTVQRGRAARCDDATNPGNTTGRVRAARCDDATTRRIRATRCDEFGQHGATRPSSTMRRDDESRRNAPSMLERCVVAARRIIMALRNKSFVMVRRYRNTACPVSLPCQAECLGSSHRRTIASSHRRTIEEKTYDGTHQTSPSA